MVVYIKADLEQNLKMNTPGVGNKKRKFKQLLGWGKNGRKRLKQLTQSRTKLSRSFAVNELSQIKLSYPALFVVNLDDRAGKGSHWIGVAVYMKSVFICDTLGGSLPDKKSPKEWTYFLELITSNRKLIVTKTLSESGLCGLFCVTFIKEMARTNNFCDFISLFSSNLSTNDTVVKFLNK